MAWKEYCAEYWLKGLQESMDRCTSRRDITEITLQTALKANQSIIQSPFLTLFSKGFPPQAVVKIRDSCTSRLNPLLHRHSFWRINNRVLENVVGKGEIARNEQFLLFPQRFLLSQIIVSPFGSYFWHHTFICCWTGIAWNWQRVNVLIFYVYPVIYI